MSYSFSVRAATKALALAAIALKLDEVVAQQPVHAADRQQAQDAANLFVGVLPEDESRDVAVSVSGWVSGRWQGSELLTLEGASVTISANLVAKDPS